MHLVAIDANKHNGHSFWIGVATTAVSKGIEELLIKTIGKMGEHCMPIVYLYSYLKTAGWLYKTFCILIVVLCV